jgi:hypothetical protein
MTTAKAAVIHDQRRAVAGPTSAAVFAYWCADSRSTRAQLPGAGKIIEAKKHNDPD